MSTAVAERQDQTDLCADLRAQIATQAVELPMLPQTASEVITLASAEECDARALAGLIQHDPILATEVLRVANSPLFRSDNQIVSLQQAIARMGVGRVRDIALAIALKTNLFKPSKYTATLHASWRHAVGTAAWAREVARLCRVNAELAYLGGLLHDIGVPVVLQLLERQVAQALPAADVRALLDELSPQAGCALIRHWGLPDVLAKVVEECRNPDVCEPTASIVGTARWLDDVDANVDPEELIAAPELLRMNLYPEDIARLWKVRPRIQSMVEALSL